MRAVLDLAAREASVDALDLRGILAALHEWSADDVKTTPLKTIQGMIWRDGFESGAIVGHLYPDAVEALRRYRRNGVLLAIYSSGSVAAQRLLFGHSVAGNLLAHVRGILRYDDRPEARSRFVRAHREGARLRARQASRSSRITHENSTPRAMPACKRCSSFDLKTEPKPDPNHAIVATFADIDVRP